jgi:S-DNA-T family DNA segregation ATPase FtsK/SpoIIIE
VYAEAAATGDWVDLSRPAAGADSDEADAHIDLDLPPVRPLNSPLALEYLSEKEKNRGKNDAAGSVERALEEAEQAAAMHSEKARKKSASHGGHKRKYRVPLEILNQYPDGEYWVIDQATREAAVTLKQTLEEFKIQAEVTGIRKGPVITMFEILPAPGIKLSRIINLQDNIALRLAASSVRIVAPIPGKHAVGIEVPNAKRNIVSFREIIEGELQREGKRPEIPVVMGKDITGEALTVDLTQTPHLLIAGATGSGKSVCVNSSILSILYLLPPSDCRLILIDPKIVELKLYNDIPHLLTPVITEPKRAFQALQYCIFEMERRYACLDSMGVRDIRNYNKRVKERDLANEYLPYIVIIVDEFADLMATTGKELETTVSRLAAMSRAVGIHLVLATQRPSIGVITGLIKANIPTRIAFMVASMIDSRIIIDTPGAEKLLGKGDMLFSGVVDPFPVRMQGAFVSEEEVEAVVAHVKTLGEPDYIDDEIFYDEDEEELSPSLFSDGDDPLYDKALEIVLQQGKASASYIQRRLKIGYNRAARLVEEMEQRGVVGPAQGSKPREILHRM